MFRGPIPCLDFPSMSNSPQLFLPTQHKLSLSLSLPSGCVRLAPWRVFIYSASFPVTRRSPPHPLPTGRHRSWWVINEGGGELVCSDRYVISGAPLWPNAVISSVPICIYVQFAHPIIRPVCKFRLPSLGKGNSRRTNATQSHRVAEATLHRLKE